MTAVALSCSLPESNGVIVIAEERVVGSETREYQRANHGNDELQRGRGEEQIDEPGDYDTVSPMNREEPKRDRSARVV